MAHRWSFSLLGKSQPRVYSTLQDAIREVRATRPDATRIRSGLTGPSTDAQSTIAAMFVPCPNNALAARQIT